MFYNYSLVGYFILLFVGLLSFMALVWTLFG
jgi:hypothetical protein